MKRVLLLQIAIEETCEDCTTDGTNNATTNATTDEMPTEPEIVYDTVLLSLDFRHSYSCRDRDPRQMFVHVSLPRDEVMYTLQEVMEGAADKDISYQFSLRFSGGDTGYQIEGINGTFLTEGGSCRWMLSYQSEESSKSRLIETYDVSFLVEHSSIVTLSLQNTEGDITIPPETDPPETDPPATDPPETDPPETDPPETDPPETDPPETDPPETDPPETVGTLPMPSQSGGGARGTSTVMFYTHILICFSLILHFFLL